MVVRLSELPLGASGGVFPRPVRGFAGRRAELDRMLAHLEEDVVFLVYGVGGIGKTELVYRLMAEVRERPEWRDAVPVHLELRAGETTTRALAELLATIGAPPEPRSGQPTEVAHLTEQLALLARILDERPHLVFLDDVHHLPPEPVAEALAHFSRHVRRSRIFVASRREIRLRPDAEPPIVTTLGPLDAEAATEMMEALATRLQVERPEASVLMRSTHGSPFHIRRLLVGSSGDDALARSLDDLGVTARRALVLGALAPHRPSVRVLRERMRDRTGERTGESLSDDTDESLRELERRFLADVKDGRLVVHDLVREELLRVIGQDELRAGRIDAAASCIAELERGGSLLHAVDAIGLALTAGQAEQAWSRAMAFEARRRRERSSPARAARSAARRVARASSEHRLVDRALSRACLAHRTRGRGAHAGR